MRTESAAPRASLLIQSIRDIGYSLESAMADVVDNSITAGATQIKIFADTPEPGAKIAVVDNGCGMTEQELFDAMRLGSRNPLDANEAHDLGRFGLGLKTASFSQCRRFTVVTRRSGNTSAACWDLDFVTESDKWLIRIPDVTDNIPWIETLPDKGTLVLWEELDRISSQDLVHRVNDARSHLELVFHRFLSGERGIKKVKIRLNESPLEPFDPFHRKHAATIPGSVEKIQLGKATVKIQAFTLPHHSKVSHAEWEKYAGAGGYLKNQGFYLYREKRLIVHGTWFGLAHKTELTKLARVRIDVSNDLDSDWKIDVKKASARPPFKVRERLKKIIAPLGAVSKQVYRGRSRRLTDSNMLPVWQRLKQRDQIIYRVNPEHPVFQCFADRLEVEAQSDFQGVLDLVGMSIPLDALIADLGGAPDKVVMDPASIEALRYSVLTTYKSLVSQFDHETVLEMMMVAEPFNSQWKQVEKIISEDREGENRSA